MTARVALLKPSQAKAERGFFACGREVSTAVLFRFWVVGLSFGFWVEQRAAASDRIWRSSPLNTQDSNPRPKT